MTDFFIPVESFFETALAADIWPESIAANADFREQSARRCELKERLDDVINRLPRPDTTIESAIHYGYITQELAARMYDSLSDLLESGPDYWRIILYLPFEFLPKAPARFKRAYMKSWERLLSVHDVRANFVDGDILEAEQYAGTLPRVVKAAHLIPKLIENGFMEVKDAIKLMEETGDQILKDSIADALSAGEPKKITSSDNGNITEKRKAWLRQLEKEKVIEALAKSISAAILERGHWESSDPDTKEALLRTLRRLHHSGVVSKEQLAELDITIPKLEGPFSENLKLMSAEMSDLQKMAASIQLNQGLSHLIYPIVLLFGSRLKGYGAQNADIDIAVFVRPNAHFSERPRLQKLLEETFAHRMVRGKIVEFWLEEKKDNLLVRDFNDTDASLGASYWTHVLFGSAWLGAKDAIRELSGRLLIPYMRASDNNRRLYIEELEQDTLQYRLLHKGYELFFPPCGDNKGVFWDSGYRQLATKLFVSRVFLPKITP